MGSGVEKYYFVRQGCISFYCPLCHNLQPTNILGKISWKQHFQISLATLSVTILAWSFFGINSLLFYLLFWSLYEGVVRVRKRSALVCRTCGFDPFLYKQDVKKARAAVRTFWEEKIEKEKLYQGVALKNYKTLPKDGIPPEAPEMSAEVGTS